MALSRVRVSVLGISVVVLLATPNINTRAEAQAAGSSARGTTTPNPITGEGLPNPAPVVTRNWGQLPAGRKWGTTAGIDVDPIDGNIWAYERCGAATAGGGPVDCDNAPLDPIFKFDRTTPAFDARGRLWVADRGNHRIEIFDQNGGYLESRYMFGRPSGLFIKGDTIYVIDSESGPYNHPNWHDGVRIGPVDEDRVTGFIPPFERDDRVYQGTAGEGVAVDADGNVFAAEGPNSLAQAGGAFTKYSVGP
jgi:hypothetical protein